MFSLKKKNQNNLPVVETGRVEKKSGRTIISDERWERTRTPHTLAGAIFAYTFTGRMRGTYVRPTRCERADWRSTDFAAMHIVGGAAATRRVGGCDREKRRAVERRRRRSAEPVDGARSQVDGRALHLLAKKAVCRSSNTVAVCAIFIV